MASITPTDILTKPLFNWSYVAEMRQPAVKAEKDKKQAILQNEYCDVLFEKILSELSPASTIKAEILWKPNTPVVIWVGKEVFFEPHSSIPRRDCRSEIFGNTNHSVETFAIYQGIHDTVKSSIPYHEDQSIYAVLKYTDILHLLAARFDSSIAPHFTCERYTSPCGESNTYWRPQEHVIWLRFWPDGVPARHAESQKAALDGYEDRYRKRHPRVIHNPEDE
jgi:hypothetical protein